MGMKIHIEIFLTVIALWKWQYEKWRAVIHSFVSVLALVVNKITIFKSKFILHRINANAFMHHAGNITFLEIETKLWIWAT
jgi:hypothetical protein